MNSFGSPEARFASIPNSARGGICLYFPRFAGEADLNDIEDDNHTLEQAYGELCL
jgi:hypothetical protein